MVFLYSFVLIKLFMENQIGLLILYFVCKILIIDLIIAKNCLNSERFEAKRYTEIKNCVRISCNAPTVNWSFNGVSAVKWKLLRNTQRKNKWLYTFESPINYWNSSDWENDNSNFFLFYFNKKKKHVINWNSYSP